jgi:AcrR family transcriptional regulator
MAAQRTISATRANGPGAHVAEMQRRRLLHALSEVIGEHGVDGLTVGRVCEQAGVSRRTFYEQFDDCEECLLATFEAQIGRLLSEILPRYEHPGRTRVGTGWLERVRNALTCLLERLDADPGMARLCVIETLRAGPAVLERRAGVLEQLATIVDRGRTEARTNDGPPPLTAQGVVGGALSVIHARLLERTEDSPGRPLVELTGPLMAMIVYPYLGPAAARAELKRPVPPAPHVAPRQDADPFKGLPIRFTYRTAKVLDTIAATPGASNRHIADHAGITDEGQISRLLGRLHKCDLVENQGGGRTKGEPNAWTLTQRGQAIHNTITQRVEAF